MYDYGKPHRDMLINNGRSFLDGNERPALDVALTNDAMGESFQHHSREPKRLLNTTRILSHGILDSRGSTN
jgi:hypothetical protein